MRNLLKSAVKTCFYAAGVFLTLGLAPISAKCNDLDLLASITNLTERIITDQDSVAAVKYDRLWALTDAIKKTPIKQNLTAAGSGSKVENVDAYLKTLETFLQIRRVNGAAFGRSTLNKLSFRALHSEMLTLTQQLCDASSNNVLTSVFESLKDAIGLSKSTKFDPNSFDEIVAGQSSGSATRISKEAQQLSMVFGLLVATIIALMGVNYTIKKMRNIRLDRYTCKIPTRVSIGSVEIEGWIDVLGRQGLSFQTADRSAIAHSTLTTPNRRAVFTSGDIKIAAMLTRGFGDGGGFQITVPLSREKTAKLHAQSQVKPNRMFEFSNKKKPAQPVRSSPVSKTRRTPAN